MGLRAEIAKCAIVGGCCGKIAIDIARSALGYRKESEVDTGSITTEHLVSNFGSYFPRHKVVIYCPKTLQEKITEKNTSYGGETSKSEFNPCIWIFSYTNKSNPMYSHMVIGEPIVVGAMGVACTFKIML